MSDLRSRIIRLAAANPELRADLLPLLKEDANPASADQNKPESYYGLAPRGVQASHGVPSLSDLEAARRSVLAGLKRAAWSETLERTRTYGGNELEKAFKIVKTMLQKHLPKYKFREAVNLFSGGMWRLYMYGEDNPATPELYFNIEMTVNKLWGATLSETVVTIISYDFAAPLRDRRSKVIREFPFSTRIFAFEFQKIAKKIQEREAKESVSGRPNKSVDLILTLGLNKKLNKEPKAATLTPQGLITLQYEFYRLLTGNGVRNEMKNRRPRGYGNFEWRAVATVTFDIASSRVTLKAESFCSEHDEYAVTRQLVNEQINVEDAPKKVGEAYLKWAKSISEWMYENGWTDTFNV